MADIFLSYNEKDRAVVRSLARTLEAAGWSVWWDRRLPAGMTWRRLLEQELQAMRCMLVLWSSHSVQSDWVCEEATEGRLLDRLIPVRIEDVRPPAGFRELQAANLVGWDGTLAFPGLRELMADIEHKIGPPPQPAPSTTPVHTTAPPVPPAPTIPWWWLGAIALALAVAVALYIRPPAHPAPETSAAPAVDRRTAEPPAPTATASAQPATPAPVVAAPSPGKTPARLASKTPIVLPSASTPSTSRRCAALRERQEVGETLSDESRSFFLKEC
jgi:hypothetical protein